MYKKLWKGKKGFKTKPPPISVIKIFIGICSKKNIELHE